MKIDGARVRELRLERSWSQELLAEKAGLNLRTVQRLEASGTASLRTKRLVAAAIGVAASSLDAVVDIAAASDSDAGSSRPPARQRTDSQSIAVGVYAVCATLLFGFVLLDQIYAGLISRTMSATDSASVLGRIADLLLEYVVLVGVVACVAIGLVWNQRKPRLLLLASAFCGLILPVLIVAIVGSLLPALRPAVDGQALGVVLRFTVHGAAAVLAIMAWIAMRRGRMAAVQSIRDSG